MTNKDAIIWLRGIREQFTGNCTTDTLVFISRCDIQALDLAIKALEDKPQGEWIIIDDTVCECPRCKHQQTFLLSPKESNVNFCEKCGADMRGDRE